MRRAGDRARIRNIPVPEPHLAGIAIGLAAHLVHRCTLPGSRTVHHMAGWPLIAAGGWLAARSVAAAGRVDLARADRVVTTGPYAVIRNPMYVAWGLVHLGIGLAAGSVWVVASLPATAGLIHREVLDEEHRLAADLGAAYERYRRGVPRYLPTFPRARLRR